MLYFVAASLIALFFAVGYLLGRYGRLVHQDIQNVTETIFTGKKGVLIEPNDLLEQAEDVQKAIAEEQERQQWIRN